MFEVELKFPLADPRPVVARLQDCGAQAEAPIEQRDVYFQHPTRDFARTDEAIRLRSFGNSNCLTYKGPVQDRLAKVRREIEAPLGDGPAAAQRCTEILAALGFVPVRSVEKRRSPWRLEWQGRPLEVCVDEVSGLGTYLEIEAVAEGDDRHAARDTILDLAQWLRLSQPEQKSYLCLLLAQDAEATSPQPNTD
ncbi:MAG: class IV adenylate cyclase [Planctomycetales bacterium]